MKRPSSSVCTVATSAPEKPTVTISALLARPFTSFTTPENEPLGPSTISFAASGWAFITAGGAANYTIGVAAIAMEQTPAPTRFIHEFVSISVLGN